ncbi:MAG TPA: ABC transporter substrate-binding protein [Burkholderiales bacterium]|jgi:phospholipid transport system substrate-binding protein|nr:ABC transporter substrate-binding protein [Burkholderiales bacterium]
MLNFLRVCLLSVAVGLLASGARAQITAPDLLVRQTVEEVLRILQSDRQVQAGNLERIARLMEEKVAPHFDFARMTRLAVGRSWREATPEQRETLMREFRTLLVRSYSAAFTFYQGIAVEYRPLRMNPGDQEATVGTVVRLPGGAQPITVDYDMALTDSGWKVFDVRIDGASLVINYRNVFSQEIQRGGIEGLIRSLIAKNSGRVSTGAKTQP